MIFFRNIKKKYLKCRLNRITRVIIIIILISTCLPFFLEIFIWRNNFPSAISNSDWSSFLGSYLGGIIGGFATLLALRFTLLETRKDYYKDFLIQMINISALCLGDIRKYKTELEIGKLLMTEIDALRNQIETIQSDINTHNPPNLSGIEENLIKELQIKMEEFKEKQKSQNDFFKTLQNIENSIQHNYNILDIYLRDISVGYELLNRIKQTLEYVSLSLDNLQEYDKYDEYIEQLSEEEILSKTNDFVEAYKREYLF